ncbi:MAG: hypothetical protein WD470_12155 [Rhodospirillaceae bacterium]
MRGSFRSFGTIAGSLGAVGLALALSGAPASASSITIDGNLSDWGVFVGDNNTSNFSSPSTGIGLLASFTEDQNDEAGDGGYVGPNHGGQNYDAEFLGVALQGSTLYLAIVSGQRPDNGATKFGPGDIHMTINGVNYGIEVGGGNGGVVAAGDAGATYALNSNGFTTGIVSTNAAQTAGSVWTDISWIDDPIAPATEVQMQVDGGSTQVGTAEYVYTGNTVTGQHSIIELALDISNLLGEDGEGLIGIYWSPSCGNDIVQALVLAAVPQNDIPEPGSAFVWMLGVAALVGARYRRKLVRRA